MKDEAAVLIAPVIFQDNTIVWNSVEEEEHQDLDLDNYFIS